MDNNRELKAYVVRDNWGDFSVLVFAAGRGQAKSMAFGIEAFCDGEYIDMRCRREPRADGLVTEFGEGPLATCTTKELRLMRQLGWFEIEALGCVCEDCDLHEWQDLPESILSDDGKCVECQEKWDDLKKAKPPV